jgi:hypothetical protein
MKPQDFLALYWLKAELIEFCQEQNISARGSKAEISARIAAHLRAQTPTPRATNARAKRRTRRKPRVVPAQFTLDTVIGEDWRASAALRKFLQDELGEPVTNAAALRTLLEVGRGQTLKTALETWRETRVTLTTDTTGVLPHRR